MKKIIFILGVFFFLSLTFVSADIISINSGGGLGFIINPSWGIEDFFLNSNRFPVASNVILNSSWETNTTNENLTVHYSSYDPDREPITNITDWRVDQNSIAVLNMPFDKRVTSTSSGAVRDYSTYENDGTLGAGVSTKAPIWTSSGQVGGAYTFDGVDDYVHVPYDSSLSIADNITVSFWAYHLSTPSGYASHHIIKALSGVTANANFVDYFRGEGPDANKLQFIADRGGSWGTVSPQSEPLNLKEWYHVVWTYNKDIGGRLYINNSEVPGGPVGSGTLGTNEEPLRIGHVFYGGHNYFNGSIDEVMIFDRALSSEQISMIYEAGLAEHQLEELSSEETDVGETWQVAITPNDVYDDGLTVLSNNLTIINAIPNDPTNVNLVSLNGRNESDTDLNCSAFVSDPDSSSLIVHVDWLENDVSQFSQSFSNQVNGSLFWALLGNGNLTLGDVWKCSVRVSDSYDNSSWVDSNEVEIIDITNPNITIVSPLTPIDINYTDLEVDFNISIEENEAISNCYYDLNGTENVSMTEFNSTYYWSEPSNLIPGNHNVTFWCNDTSGNWGTNFTNFTILDEAAIAIQLSPSLSWNVNWSLSRLPTDDEDATGNNGPNATDYYINISATAVTADVYVRADGNLINDFLDVILLGNETYAINTSNSSVPNPSKITMTTDYVKIGDNLDDGSVIYLKFYLDAPAAQPAGIYLNSLDFKAVSHGASL